MTAIVDRIAMTLGRANTLITGLTPSGIFDADHAMRWDACEAVAKRAYIEIAGLVFQDDSLVREIDKRDLASVYGGQVSHLPRMLASDIADWRQAGKPDSEIIDLIRALYAE